MSSSSDKLVVACPAYYGRGDQIIGYNTETPGEPLDTLTLLLLWVGFRVDHYRILPAQVEVYVPREDVETLHNTPWYVEEIHPRWRKYEHTEMTLADTLNVILDTLLSAHRRSREP